ncbi:MAG: 3-hydroxybutyryl-CoA dehydrogenase [Chloroflexi bacterium]|nr:3-hydroxybutyryl-CoA dehydrogenase [Chloroflexota bacterium]
MNEVTTVGVLGAGTMGAGIAQVAAEAGLEVLLHDSIAGATDRARERIGGFLARRVEKGQLTEVQRAAAVGRLGTSAVLEGLAVADIVIEAIPEELDLKREAFRRLDAVADVHTILATNTSSLAVARIAGATSTPGRVIGMHFFNPVPLMALVEVVPGPMTDPSVTDSVALLARLIGKTPVIAADTPGFIVNRVQRAYYLEACRILEGGLSDVAAIDDAMREIGFRLGPFELADVVGTDVNLAAGIAIFDGFFGDPRLRPAQVQRRVVDAGRLGRKSGAGYYDYGPDGTRGEPWPAVVPRAEGPSAMPPLDATRIQVRILAAIVNEAASAVTDGVASPEAIDTGMRLATNWPDGPLAWGERIGLASVVGTLDALHSAVPDGRYRVTPLLRHLALGAATFFSEPT